MIINEISMKLKTIFGDRLTNDENNNFAYGDYKFNLDEVFISIYSKLKSDKNTKVNFILENKAEYLIKCERPYRDHEDIVEDVNFKINFSNISNELLTKLFFLLPNERIRLSLYNYKLERLIDEKEIEIYDLLRIVFNGYESIVIAKKDDDYGFNNYSSIIRSHIFNLSMIKDKNCYLVDSIDDIIGNINRPLIRRVSRNEANLDIPRLEYNQDLVEYYISGNSAKVPLVKFLSYYNIIEYFFESVFIEDRSRKIQKIITSPKFHHNNLENYKNILNALNIKKAKHLNGNSFDEKESFKLVLIETLNEAEFKSFINDNSFFIDNDAYKSTNTKFSLEDSFENTIAKLVNRIYLTRNALVHSKEGNDIKYAPGKDDIHIIKEIPLVKFISEQVIVKKSTYIKYD